MKRGPYPRVGSRHNTAGGEYGRGIYLTASALLGEDYSFGERNGAETTLLVSKVLVGVSHVMHGIWDKGCLQRENVDSHASDDSLREVVIFDPAQILPVYRVTLNSTLHGAARRGMAQEDKQLIAAGRDVNEARPLDGATPVYVAAEIGRAHV